MLPNSFIHLPNDNIQVSVFINQKLKAKRTVKYAYNRNKSLRPRRNKSAFLLFSAEKRAQLKAEGENLNSNQMMSKLADMWRNLSLEERKRYDVEAERDKERYLIEIEAYKKEHPSAAEVHNRTKKNHIRKPSSAYGLFLKEVKDEIKKVSPHLLMADVLKIVSQKWKNLSESEKFKYYDKAEREKAMSLAQLECKGLEAANTQADTPGKQKKEKQLKKPRKQIKSDTNHSSEPSLNDYTLNSPFAQLEKFPEDSFLQKENFNPISYDPSICEPRFSRPTSSELDFRMYQLLDIPPPPPPQKTAFSQPQNTNLSTQSNLPLKEPSKQEKEPNDIFNLLDRFRSSSDLFVHMFNPDGNSSKRDETNLLNPMARSNQNGILGINSRGNPPVKGFSAYSSKQEALNNVLMSALDL